MNGLRNKVFLNKAVFFLVALLIIAISSSSIGLKKYSKFLGFHPDEFVYCYYAGLLKAYVNGHFDNAIWRSKLGYAAVPVGGYWIGSTIYFGKYNFMLQEPSMPWKMNIKGFLNNPEEFIKKMHPFPYVEDMIHVLRERMLLFRTLTCILLFVLVWCMGGYVPAAFAVFLTLRNELFIELSSLVLLETIWFFQYFLNLLCICFFFRILSDRKPGMTLVVLCSVAIGLTLGLLAATKIHGGLNALILLIFFAIFWIARWRAGCWDINLFRITFLNVCFILLLALSVFIVVNPILYTNPIAGIRDIIFMRFNTEQHQIVNYQQLYLSDIFQRVVFIVKTLELNIYRFVLSLLGIIFLLSKIKLSWRGGGAVYAVGVIVSFVVYLFAILMFMRMAWTRYPSILVFYLNIFIGYSIWCILRTILKKVRKWPSIFQK